MNSPLEQLCCTASNPYPDDATEAKLFSLCGSITDWSALEQLVKDNRIAALLYWHNQQGHICLPKDNELQLASWFIRNRKVANVRDAWLTILTDKLNEAGIDHAYLKGTALCHLIYPSPYIRSMDDIDILIDDAHNDQVYQTLLSLGVSVKMPTTNKELGCHQWPIATVFHEGVKFDIEIHTRVLSRRIGGYGFMSDFKESLVPFAVGEQTRYALSHEDFLITQLYRFKSLTEIFRLIDVTDIAAHLECYAFQIDWKKLYKNHAWIQNSLMAINCVTPLSQSVMEVAMIPNRLEERLFDLRKDPYNGLPVNRYLKARNLYVKLPLLTRIVNTVFPSLWWMSLVYGTSEKLSDKVKGYLVLHPISVMKQIYRAFMYK
jgi:hypothetical protein